VTQFQILSEPVLDVVNHIQLGYSTKRANPAALTRVLNQLYREPSDAIYRQTMRETGINPQQNDMERALTARVTTRYTRALLGSTWMGGSRS
jgi:hypothetical protein